MSLWVDVLLLVLIWAMELVVTVLVDKLMIDLMVLGVVKLMEKRLCRLVDGSMHHMVSTVNVQKTMPQQVSVVSTTKVTVHKILSLVFNAANSPNKLITLDVDFVFIY